MKVNRVRYFMLLTILISGCAVRKVTEIDPSTKIYLSGRWNDSDAQMVAEAMVPDMLSRPWLTEFIQQHGRKPIVIVGYIKNMSLEHVNMEVFIKDIERELINSGKVGFVASEEEREQIRKERENQQLFASPETAKRLAQEVGADFVLTGSFKSVEDRYKGKKVILYSVDLELIDVEKNLIVWIGNKKIKKFIKTNLIGP